MTEISKICPEKILPKNISPKTEVSIPTESILLDPKGHCSAIDSSQENDKDSKLPEVEVNTSTDSIFTDSENLPNTEASVPSSSHVNISNKCRPPISILPEDPEEKRKSVINKVLEQFPYLSSKYSNKDHKKENIRFIVEGECDSEDYVNTKNLSSQMLGGLSKFNPNSNCKGIRCALALASLLNQHKSFSAITWGTL
ncbi:11754_t:CDS:1 [Acaulospora morrowiae]|uniref:11754_t:CDS:1 n=1 Tax=Acaulospora morrowiae TaxID=94023 RepID=A0A9N9NS21_9GLOM|nr:11754_t:CDS:1 [Acaulospora morrowiae]